MKLGESRNGMQYWGRARAKFSWATIWGGSAKQSKTRDGRSVNTEVHQKLVRRDIGAFLTNRYSLQQQIPCQACQAPRTSHPTKSPLKPKGLGLSEGLVSLGWRFKIRSLDVLYFTLPCIIAL